MPEARRTSLPANCRLFIAFRVFFNARFYYPVLGILFLDLGVTLGEYALLNTAWAFTIVLLEVPSGALADHYGRKRMVVGAAALMVVEMALLAFAPAGHSVLLLAFLLANRILSGVAEAFASGADEALAYDSLVACDRAEEWPRVLELLGRWQAGAFFCAMALGAALFDAAWVNQLLYLLGMDGEVTAAQTLRFPLYLTLATSLATLVCSLRMREPSSAKSNSPYDERQVASPALGKIVEAARWIVGHRSVLLLLLSGLTIDSIIRLFLTMNSNYYRLVGIPEGWYGLIGSGFSLVGFLSASLARKLAGACSRRVNFMILGSLALGGVFVVALVRHPLGLVATLPLALSFQMLGFLLSYYLNADVPSTHRATALSFRSLAFNLGYGGAGIAFSLLCAGIARAGGYEPGSDAVLDNALVWLPGWLVAGALAIIVSGGWGRKRSRS